MCFETTKVLVSIQFFISLFSFVCELNASLLLKTCCIQFNLIISYICFTLAQKEQICTNLKATQEVQI